MPAFGVTGGPVFVGEPVRVLTGQLQRRGAQRVDDPHHSKVRDAHHHKEAVWSITMRIAAGEPQNGFHNFERKGCVYNWGRVSEGLRDITPESLRRLYGTVACQEIVGEESRGLLLYKNLKVFAARVWRMGRDEEDRLLRITTCGTNRGFLPNR